MAQRKLSNARRRPRRQTWPIALGWTCIAIGLIGAAWYGIRTGSSHQDIQADVAVLSADPSVPLQIASKWGGRMTLVSGALLVSSLLLVIGGALLLRRRRHCLPVLMAWAFLKIVLVGWWCFIHAAYDRDVLDLTFGGPNAMAGDGAKLAAVAARKEAIAVLGVRAAWLVLLPGFLLFWFSRKELRDHIRDWR